ncbi:MAG: hypothetical protein ACI9MR_002712 [Myxococcota bacterium]|jgi:uncharacterized protein YfaS (alpha-2-macroglobulin family)
MKQALIAIATLLVACSGSTTTDPPDGLANPLFGEQTEDEIPSDAPGKGFVFSVSDGNPIRGAHSSSKAATAMPLNERKTATLLSRLPSIGADASDTTTFAFRPSSTPPPRTGDVVRTPFPPPSKPPLEPTTIKLDPLEVLRYQPEGDVPVAPRISVTFNNPMVAITSHDTLAKQAVPVEVTPDVEGAWRWVGTKTLFFEPTGRAPMATTYTVKVPAGTKDALGQTLASDTAWTFQTPPPTVRHWRPAGNSVALDPTFVVLFDQRIEPQKLLPFLKVEAGGKTANINLLSQKAVAQLPEASNKDIEGRFIAFKVASKLTPATSVVVTLRKGAPSAEGRGLTESDQSHSFSTYGPFEITEHRCDYRECRPAQPWSITLSNQFDLDGFEPSQITVSPTVEGLRTDIYGSRIQLRGLTKGRTTYTVTLSRKLKDSFGQTLTGKDSIEFEVGEADPMMAAPDQGLLVLDPAAKKKRFSIYTVNYDEIDVALYSVTPSDFAAWNTFVTQRSHDNPPSPPGKRVWNQRVKTNGASDELNEVQIDLSPALTGDFGQVVLIAKPVGAKNIYRERRHTILAWLQSTLIGLDAFADNTDLVGWTTSLASGKPLDGVTLTLQPQGKTSQTDSGGLATIPLPATAPKRQLLVATKGNDTAFLPDNSSRWSSRGRWQKQTPQDSLRWMVFDDRKLYRPSETVSIKGIIRLHEAGKKGDITALPAGHIHKLEYRVVGSRGNELHKGSVKVSTLGTFDFNFELPGTPNLGNARVEIRSNAKGIGGATYNHGFQIQEFRRPEFEVNAATSTGPHFVGGKASMTVKAAYFSGGPLPNADVNWSVRSRIGSFSPPNQAGFTFGTWTPWWRGGHGNDMSKHHSHSGQTNGSGEHTINLDLVSVDPPRTMTITGEATIQDVSRQTWTSSANLLVHPAAHYVGLRTERSFVEPKQPIDVDAVVANIDGKRLKGSKIAMTMTRLEWKRDKKRGYLEVEVGPQTCSALSAEQPARCTFTPKGGGQHRIRARITDAAGRANESQITVWVPGGKRPPTKRIESEAVELIPEQRDYQPGETAKVLVQAPFWPAEGVMHVLRDGMVTTEHFSMQGPSHTLEIPVEEWMIPNFSVRVQLAGASPRTNAAGDPDKTLPTKPAFGSGQIQLRVPPTVRKLTVVATPAAEKVAPGAKTSVALSITDHEGNPVKDAELAVIVVDEAVLALTGYRIPDPLGVFYTSRGSGLATWHLREKMLLATLDELYAAAEQPEAEESEMMMDKMAEGAPPPSPSATAAPMRKRAIGKGAGPGGGGGGDAAPPIAVRKDFNALALFAPAVTTDSDGKATVEVKLPDSLTRYRVMVVAAAGKHHFGSGESHITARLPLMVRVSAPRFLNFGDRFELPVVIQNQTDDAMDVEVAVRATNAEFRDGQGRSVRIPANDRVEVRFPAAAAMAGIARFQAGATSGSWSDAAEVKLPVWTPATTEAFATYGEIDGKGAVQPVQAPADVVTQFGGLEIATSSTQLQALTDAVLYLTSYPYECSEQISSRVLSIAALRDVLTAFEAEGLPSPEAMIASVTSDLKRLAGMQGNDGGWAFWRRDQRSWPFLTAHVTHALARAKAKKFAVPENMLRQAQRYLVDIERHIPSEYGPSIRRVIKAYALYVRHILGDKDPRGAKAIIKEAGLKALSLEAIGWLYPVLTGAQGYEADIKAIRKHLNNKVTETAGLAHFTTSYSDGAHLILHSSRRADGLLLEGLIGDQPTSDLIPKMVRGLLAHRTKGRWGNTQENAWVLLGLDRYFHAYENVEPDFVARVWLGKQFAGQHAFKGRTTETHQIDVPMAVVAKTAGQQDLTIGKDGPGRLYYRLGMRYAPKSLKLEPANHGFHVERVYEAVDNDGDVTRDDDGRWIIRAGAKVRITLTMVAQTRRYHVALVDPMPAGLESLNPALKGTASIADNPSSLRGNSRGGRHSWRWWGPWYQHQNLRDERAEAFTSLLWGGVHTYSYIAQATTPGEFIVPPPKAEEMYHPETFGRGATDIVVVRE